MRYFGQRSRSSLTGRDLAAFVIGILGFAIGALYPLPIEIFGPLLGVALTIGVLANAVFHQWFRQTEHVPITNWTEFRHACWRGCRRVFFHGLPLGVVLFGLVSATNGRFGNKPSYEVLGRVTGKSSRSSKGGRGCSLEVLDPRSGLSFRCGVPEIEHALTGMGAERRLVIREGLLGWPYRIIK